MIDHQALKYRKVRQILKTIQTLAGDALTELSGVRVMPEFVDDTTDTLQQQVDRLTKLYKEDD